MEKLIRDIFFKKFSVEPIIVRSPGRFNIIGEHTDYNEGFVLPAAIDKFTYVGVSKRDDDKIMLYSRNFDEDLESNINTVSKNDTRWTNYILGVVDQLQRHGHKPGGFNLVFDGNIPVGAGLSSSAGLECASIFALNELFALNVDRLSLVKMAQLAEHTFVGVKCGIMDQFASMFGKKGHAIKLDCRSLEFEYVPVQLEGYKIVLLNTNVKHELVSSGYNTRRAQCEQGVAWVKEHIPAVKTLRDVTIEMLDKYVLKKDPFIYKRCRYVIEENARLLRACEDLKTGNLKALGQKIFETHRGLSEEYEVSCKELDFLVNAVKSNPAVLGARMVGGGFGGCTINIVKEEAVDNLIEQLTSIYKKEMGLDLSTYIAGIEQGTELISDKSHVTIV
ncbi:MAG: galactokinase [Chitinophagaceae bacterium]